MIAHLKHMALVRPGLDGAAARWALDELAARSDVRTLDPTTRGDIIADIVRQWYETHRESFWARHRPGFFTAPDRSGVHADNFMLELVAVVNAAERETPK